MTSRGFELRLIEFKALICALCKVNSLTDAQKVFEKMLMKDWNPDEVLWAVLIDGLLNEGFQNVCTNFL